MGLDMYLYKDTYVLNWDHTPKEKRFSISVQQNGKNVAHIQPDRISNIRERIGYWRKANAIHAWFVKNVQNGNDDCGSYYVSDEQLETLLNTVRKVLSSIKMIDSLVGNGQILKDGEWETILEDGQIIDDSTVAQELLPAQSGFFFGSTDYDQWYVGDLKETEQILIAAIEDSKRSTIYYESSW